MIRRLQFGVVLVVLLASTSAYAKLTQCRPTAQCVAVKGKKPPHNPCHTGMAQGETKSLILNPVGGAGVIRVSLCGIPVGLCGSDGGPLWQIVSVRGYAGNQEIYSMTLSGKKGPADTGPYTKLEGLSRIEAHCDDGAGGNCSFIWQVCREELPIQTP